MKTGWRSVEFSSRQLAICEYAEKLTKSPAEMSDADVKSLRDQGLDDRAILDVIQVTSYFNYINRVADAIGVPMEENWSLP